MPLRHDNTNAARQARFYQRRKEEIAALRQKVATLTARVAELERGAPAPPPADVRGLHNRIAAEEAWSVELRQEVARLDAENIQLHQRVADLEAAAPTAASGPRPDAEEVPRLKAANTQLRRQNREYKMRLQRVIDSDRNTLFISTADRRAIRAALHPDGEADPARKRRLERASQIFNGLRMQELPVD